MGDLYVIRHGQTTCNADGIVQGPRVDSDLSDTGRMQARLLGSAFGSTDLDAVYCSPMQRARATADAITDALPADTGTRVVPEMYEMDYGAFCGRPLDEVRSDMEQIFDAWSMGFIHESFPDGESPVITQHRVRRFADRLLDAAQDQSIAVIAHGRVNRVLVATLVDAALSELERFPQDNANITHLEVTGDGASMQRLNDTTHLGSVEPAFS